MKLHIGELAKAMVKFQSEVPELELNKTVKVTTKAGQTYTFQYADLAEIKSKIKKPLSANGLAYSQLLKKDGIETILMHTSGEYMREITPLVGIANNAQEYGSQTTYIKRYSLVAILGLVADEDDDANVAVGNKAEFAPKPTTKSIPSINTPPVDGDTGFTCATCKAKMVFKEGVAKTGKPYKGYFCPKKQIGEEGHKPFFIES